MRVVKVKPKEPLLLPKLDEHGRRTQEVFDVQGMKVYVRQILCSNPKYPKPKGQRQCFWYNYAITDAYEYAAFKEKRGMYAEPYSGYFRADKYNGAIK